MRIVFIGPSIIDDPRVHDIFRHRIALAKKEPIVIEGDLAEFPEGCTERYSQFLANLEGQIEPIDEIGVVVPTSFGRPENEILDGLWSGICEFQEMHLPGLREQINAAIGDGQDVIVHVDLGDCFTTLYAAYFATLSGVSTSLTFHVPAPGQSFAIGGHSVYAAQRPMLRRRLATEAIMHAARVHVAHPDLAGAMSSLFPRLKVTYFGDPLTVAFSDPQPEALPSGTEG
jgi:hypothetical protein